MDARHRSSLEKMESYLQLAEAWLGVPWSEKVEEEEIWGSYRSDYEDSCPLECDTL
jgi:hypothetical protein